MKKSMMLIGAVIIIFFMAISFSIRKNDFNNVTGARNLEATYHALLTIKALQASSIKNHWLLPTVSLGQEKDKNIRWGSTVPTKTGDYIYTSFTPPGFLAPYIFFSSFNIEASEKNLARFNFFLGSLVSLILYALLMKILDSLGYSRYIAVIGATLGTTISIFSKEVLQSHGVVYWVHSFYQLLLITCLYSLLAYLNSTSGQNGNKTKYTTCLVAITFLSAWSEWTGYVFGVGLAILFYFGILIDRPQRRLAIMLMIACAAAGLITLIHYGAAVGFKSAIKEFMARFLARNTDVGSLLSLLYGYSLSFGLFILVVFGAVLLPFFRGGGGEGYQSKCIDDCAAKNKVAFLFLAATIPLLENVVMLQHANQFSFDRLKLLFPMAMIIAIAFARQRNVWRVVLAIFLVFASIHGYASYRTDLYLHREWAEMDFNNKLLANAIVKSTEIDCSLMFSTVKVRGYANLLFNRGIYHGFNKNYTEYLIKKTKACSAIVLSGNMKFSDQPQYTNAVIIKENGSEFSLSFLDVGAVKPDFFLTDRNWRNGVSKRFSGFFVPNRNQLKTQLAKGSDLIFQNGETRKILDVRPVGNYLHVYVEGALLESVQIGLPVTYILRGPLVYKH